MKKLLIIILLLTAQVDVHAQNVRIVNKRECTVQVKLAGTTSGPCGNYVVYLNVPAMSAVAYPVGTIGASSVPPVTASAAGVVWNYAEIRNGSLLLRLGNHGRGGQCPLRHLVSGAYGMQYQFGYLHHYNYAMRELDISGT